MESADENDRFHEANLILSSALKQLDEAMSKNGKWLRWMFCVVAISHVLLTP